MENSSDAYEERGRGLLDGGQADEALAVFENGLVRFPADADLQLGKAVALVDLRRAVEAEVILEKLIERFPTLGDALWYLARARMAQGKREGAIAAARQAWGPHEQDADFVHEVAHLFYKNGDHEMAIEGFRQAVKLNRAHQHSWLGLASSLHRARRVDEAISVLHEVISDRLPGFWEGYSYLGCMLFDAGRAEEAEKILRKIPLDELRDPAAVQRLRAAAGAGDNSARAKVLAIIEKRAKEALPREAKPRKARPKPHRGAIIVGPVGADIDGLKRVLRGAKLVTARGAWRGERCHLLLIGPFIIGPNKRQNIATYIQRLRDEARATGCGSIQVVHAPGDGSGIEGVWAAQVEEFLVTATGLRPETIDRIKIERGHGSWKSGTGPWKAPVLPHLVSVIKESDLEPQPLEVESYKSDFRQLTIHGGPAAVYDQNGPLIRLNSGLGQSTRAFRYLEFIEVHDSFRRGIVPQDADVSPYEAPRLVWHIQDDIHSGHGANFSHALCGEREIAFAEGYVDWTARDEIHVFIRQSAPMPIAESVWRTIVAETRNAVEAYYGGGRHFQISGNVSVSIGG